MRLLFIRFIDLILPKFIERLYNGCSGSIIGFKIGDLYLFRHRRDICSGCGTPKDLTSNTLNQSLELHLADLFNYSNIRRLQNIIISNIDEGDLKKSLSRKDTGIRHIATIKIYSEFAGWDTSLSAQIDVKN